MILFNKKYIKWIILFLIIIYIFVLQVPKKLTTIYKIDDYGNIVWKKNIPHHLKDMVVNPAGGLYVGSDIEPKFLLNI